LATNGGNRGGLAIVAMWQLPRGFCNLPYKMSQKEAFWNFKEFFVWNAAEATLLNWIFLKISFKLPFAVRM
jgi:hypothetical protein